MAQTAIVRVKRFLEEDPLEALILNCKKRKPNEPDLNSTILTFAGTIQKDEDFMERVHKASKEELEQTLKKYTPKLAEKLRQEARDTSKKSRYKIVNCFRTLDISNQNAGGDANFAVLDVVDENKTNLNEDKFVYDLYYTNTSEEVTFDNIEGIEPFDELVYEDYRTNEETYDETDDSNDENNWRNDYPDSDIDKDSSQDEEIMAGFRHCHIGEENCDNSLSSDDDEDLIYSPNCRDYRYNRTYHGSGSDSTYDDDEEEEEEEDDD